MYNISLYIIYNDMKKFKKLKLTWRETKFWRRNLGKCYSMPGMNEQIRNDDTLDNPASQ